MLLEYSRSSPVPSPDGRLLPCMWLSQVRGAVGGAQVAGKEYSSEHAGCRANVRTVGTVRRQGAFRGHGPSRRPKDHAG